VLAPKGLGSPRSARYQAANRAGAEPVRHRLRALQARLRKQAS
jgi:hypothetical protein